MRWRLLRRRLSISAPRMIVRSHLPWPLRWVVVALSLGFSAAIALWAFEFGKDIAGLDRQSKDELAQLRIEVAQLRSERDKAQAIANTAESLMRAESVAQDRLAQQLRRIEAENLELKADLGFFQRLLPAAAGPGLTVRAMQATLRIARQDALPAAADAERQCRGRIRGALRDRAVRHAGRPCLELQPSRRRQGAATAAVRAAGRGDRASRSRPW